MMAKMTDDELLALARQELETSDIQGTNEIREQRINSYSVYVNQKVGKFRNNPNLAGVWLNEHFDYTERLTTYITKAVTSDPEVVVLETKNKGLQKSVKQTMDLLNYAIMQKSNGYKILNRQIKDACINKNGIVKAYWDTTPTYWEEEVEIGDQSIDNFINSELNRLGDDVTIEIIGEPEVTEVTVSETRIDEDTDMELQDDITTPVSQIYLLRYSAPKGFVWDNIPREEFTTNTELVSLDDELTRFVAHRREVMVGDTVAMYPEVFKGVKREGGYKTLEDAAQAVATQGDSTNNFDYDFERINRFYWDGSYDVTDSQESADPMSRRVQLVEGYYKVDYEKNGRLVWLKMVHAGDVVFEKHIVDDHPFASFAVFPIPHKFDGQSVLDVIESTMLSMTALLRSKVDNSIQRNIVRILGNRKGIDDRGFQQGRPGVVHVKNNHSGAYVPIETPAGAADTVQILSYLDQKISAKIGISSVNDGTNVDLLKSGNNEAKVTAVQQQANQNVEMYVRELCETSLRNVIWKAFKLVLDNSDSYFVKQALMRMGGMEIDPASGQPMPPMFIAAQDGMREWYDKADFIAKVGLGHQTKQEKVQSVMMGMQMLQQLPGAGVPVPPQKYLDMTEYAFKNLGLPGTMIPTQEEITKMMQAQEQDAMMAKQKEEAVFQTELGKTAAETRDKNASALKKEEEARFIAPRFELDVVQTEAEVETNKEPKFQN